MRFLKRLVSFPFKVYQFKGGKLGATGDIDAFLVMNGNLIQIADNLDFRDPIFLYGRSVIDHLVAHNRLLLNWHFLIWQFDIN